MNIFPRLALYLSLVALLAVVGCKKKDKKLTEYRSTDFIATSNFTTEKKYVEDKKEEEDNKTNPPPQEGNKPGAPQQGQPGTTQEGPKTGDGTKGNEGSTSGDANQSGNQGQPQTQGNDSSSNKPIEGTPPDDGLPTVEEVVNTPKEEQTPPPVVVLSQEVLNKIPSQEQFDKEVGELVSCAQSFSSKRAPTEDQWRQCFLKTWKEDTSKLFCDPQNKLAADEILKRQKTALDKADAVATLIANLRTFAKFHEYRNKLEQIPSEVAAQVARKTLFGQNKKFVVPKGLKSPLKTVLAKYQKLKEIEKLVEEPLLNTGKKQKVAKKQQEKRLKKMLKDFNNIKVVPAVGELNKKGFLTKEGQLKEFATLDEPLDVVYSWDAQEIPVPPAPGSDFKVSPQYKFKKTRAEWDKKVKDDLKNLKKDLTAYLSDMMGSSNSKQVTAFLEKDPMSIIDKSIEVTNWPFTPQMQLNVVDLVINDPEDAPPNFKKELYDEIYNHYARGDHQDPVVVNAFNFFNSMENIQNMESKKESLLTFMQGQDASILNDPVLKDWKQQLCASRVNFSLGKLPTADCTYQDIVNYGQQNPLQLEEAAQILDKQWFTQEAVKGETAFEIDYKEFQDQAMLSDARAQLINQNILAICSVPQEISEKPAKDVANGAGASLNTSERGTNNKPGSNPPPPVSDNKAIDAGGPAK